MAYQVENTFYEMVQFGPTGDWFIVFECKAHGTRIKQVTRGTESQCKAWLDERPGSAISISQNDRS